MIQMLEINDQTMKLFGQFFTVYNKHFFKSQIISY